MIRSKHLALLLGLLALSPLVFGQEDNCVTCHREFEDEQTGPSHMFVRDIHAQKGLGCADCHGGDTAAEDMEDVRRAKNYRGVPTHRQVPDFCARCHSNPAYMHEHNPSLPTDQLDKYKSSVHGQRMFRERDAKVADCISCHSVHEIGSGLMPHSSTHPLNLPQTCGKCHADAEYMAEYGIPTTQLDDYRQSVHGIALLERHDLGAPACNDCHGNHGAAPPGVTSLAAVCGNCHVLEAGLFKGSPHQEAFSQNDLPMCESCHSNHLIVETSDIMVGSAEPAVCVQCHEPDDGNAGLQTAMSISTAIKELRLAQEEAGKILAEAGAKGMMITDEEFLYKEVNQALIQARTQVHAFNADSVMAKTTEGLTKAETVQTNAASLIDEYYFRRKGLGLATVFITILAVALYLKIRRLEKNQ